MSLIRRLRPLGTALLPLLCAACEPADLLNALVPRDGYTRIQGLSYGPADRQKLDLYRPAGEAMANPAPIAVYVYGGSWKTGQRGHYRFIGEALTSQGLIVVVPDYRLYPDVRFPAFVEDIARAVAWTRDHAAGFGGDPRRIVLVGHSAGAHSAALLVFDRRYLDHAGVPREVIVGMVGLAGPYSFDPLDYDSTRPIFAGAGPLPIRPVTLADGDGPPLLLIHGQDDDTVKPVNTRTFANAIRQAGGEAETSFYPDLGHIGLVVSLAKPFRGRDPVFADVASFLSRVTVDPQPPAGRKPDQTDRQ